MEKNLNENLTLALAKWLEVPTLEVIDFEGDMDTLHHGGCLMLAAPNSWADDEPIYLYSTGVGAFFDERLPRKVYPDTLMVSRLDLPKSKKALRRVATNGPKESEVLETISLAIDKDGRVWAYEATGSITYRLVSLLAE
jgi:hypothetical protein